MPNPSKGSPFTEQAEALILAHLSDEHFGVSELAGAMHMSRSNLLRKCKKQTQLSASQFIRQVRLKQAMELLKDSDLTVSEVSHQVGFGSTSYFIKCFREHYGHPPGETGKQVEKEMEENKPIVPKEATVETLPFPKRYQWPLAVVFLLLLIGGFIWKPFSPTSKAPVKTDIEKSIAVLPFKNESNDATNLYFVNGLMEAALGNLQKIEDLRVISRTSVEKYRNSDKNIGEIAHDLGVNYIVEGSGQKVGDQVLLNIQLIDAATDSRIWGQQYTHEVLDIFALQNEVAKKIAHAVEANVTPSELERIDKKPTDNLVAYDYYLKAQGPFLSRTEEGLQEAIPLFEKALEEDAEFALVYADLAIAYYYLDLFKKEKKYTEQINNYADKALLYDPKLAESLMAKALYYQHTGDYRLAVPHLQKALEYNPNSSSVVQMLALLYSNFIPDTGKYLEYALKGIQLDIAANDSVAKSYIYLNLGNAFVQSGFVDEALDYIDKSLEFDPQNYYAPYLKAYILYARDKDLRQTLTRIKRELQKDTARLDILQETAKLHYFKREYDSAYHYYRQFDEIRRVKGLEVYPQEDIKLAFVYEKKGFFKEADRLFASYADYCEHDQSIYKPASMAVKYAHEGKLDLAIEQLKEFAAKNHFQYWILLFMQLDPAIAPLKKHPEFEGVMQKIEDRFWENHERLKSSLKTKELL
ncbi:helix-turn-helix domain-containing protein [Zobellia galactanivorans]|uniref:helix-turn-helix domain-containing protein n=1 Tax=Zobellia galactanivorans (strain DSM 12802 / CCUG 47099 / CIP 106680 / NCIMB 13871 / Dsij) TaxID=63186 RepID=UPI001C078A55|nr:helix-turn-helix domain-containing protein [Zobellia galactanivorans]MBU3024856.1 helix-turn-helix domain-containing protein [Zobellia galactanivorans]